MHKLPVEKSSLPIAERKNQPWQEDPNSDNLAHFKAFSSYPLRASIQSLSQIPYSFRDQTQLSSEQNLPSLCDQSH